VVSSGPIKWHGVCQIIKVNFGYILDLFLFFKDLPQPTSCPFNWNPLYTAPAGTCCIVNIPGREDSVPLEKVFSQLMMQ
jgi:hypothetical protein